MLLKQAVENLVSNALKFVPPGATPRVTISAEPTARGRVRINVRDEGVGVHAAAREKIFGVFQRGHSHEEYPGTGIGLAMVKRIAELMDGEVGLDSELGRGSCFWIELPAVSKSTPDQSA
jgi:signal transduction histidine kinase